MKKNLFFILAIISTIATVSSCSRNTTQKHSCFDQKLYDAHKNDACIENCPGVTGCDGKTYCNECLANREGIRIVK
jgi:hypothetical protein